MNDIQDLIDQSAGTDITVLLSAKETAKRRMLEDPSNANISGYDRASAMLDRALERQRSSEAVSESTPVSESIRFKRLSEVVKWLNDEGYKIKKSKVYWMPNPGIWRWQKTAGFLRKRYWPMSTRKNWKRLQTTRPENSTP